MNPYGIGYFGFIIFALGTIACIAFGVLAALATMWKQREKRDGKR